MVRPAQILAPVGNAWRLGRRRQLVLVAMTTQEELDALSSKELHDRAVKRAERHLDIKFFFELLQTLPAAEAATGDVDRSSADIFKLRALVHDVVTSDEGELADALRPFYIAYLLEHDGGAPARG